ncbi:hypothetical protein MMSR116_31585 [Methylobacterium mesophilicum SR1.6/6]|uniref:Uncharacterized protein n=1 Tax=Methylobacterium mesophilicum SR1.6/6 TaxID=908290 RepID=A0A6B9FTM6_9HYPH|nr:hypothetical protein MMSR116_31585 [Methylobacterium mesophilicum SR1.6/6]
MRMQILVWLRRWAGRRKPVRHSGILEAVAALRAGGLKVVPYQDRDGFQHWRMGDFIMTEAAVVQLAVGRGMLGDR